MFFVSSQFDFNAVAHVVGKEKVGSGHSEHDRQVPTGMNYRDHGKASFILSYAGRNQRVPLSNVDLCPLSRRHRRGVERRPASFDSSSSRSTAVEFDEIRFEGDGDAVGATQIIVDGIGKEIQTGSNCCESGHVVVDGSTPEADTFFWRAWCECDQSDGNSDDCSDDRVIAVVVVVVVSSSDCYGSHLS